MTNEKYIDILNALKECEGAYQYSKEEVVEALDIAIKVLEEESKIGHWIKYCTPICGDQHYKCTSCGYYINFGQWGEIYTKQFKYCPNCKAKMIEGSDSE